ncbi:MAG: glycosyltransferase family 1 protein [Dehalococcoidia bacterium]
MSARLLVDATTAAQATGGIRTVTRGFLEGASRLSHARDIDVVCAPDLEVPPSLGARRVGLARTRIGRLALQRAMLPLLAKHERVLLLDTSMPLAGLDAARTACFVHDLLPLEHPEYWRRPARLVKRASYDAVRRRRPAVFTSSTHNATRVLASLDVTARVARFGCGALSDDEADDALTCPVTRRRKRRIVYVGALEARKDLLTLLEAFERAAPDLENFELLLIGHAREDTRAAIAAWRRRAPATSRRVRWNGPASRGAVIEAMTSATAVVYPSHAEGFGLPVLEALALGTPVLAADLPAIRAWAGDACGYAAPGDVEAWADTLRRIARGDHPSLEAARELASGYRWRTFAETVIEGW